MFKLSNSDCEPKDAPITMAPDCSVRINCETNFCDRSGSEMRACRFLEGVGF
jgi:hypothetical protein